MTESQNIKKRGRPSKNQIALEKGNQKTMDYYFDEKTIPITEIIIGERKRTQYNETKIIELAKSIQEIGLMNPILISQDKVLIAGYHRILAFKKLGRKDIPYRMTTIKNPLKQELQEIDENLIRGDLIALEECEQIYRRKLIYEEMYPETKIKIGTELVKKRYATSDILSSVEKAFTEEIADKMGKSQRTVQRRINIARDIIEELRDLIRDTKIATKFNELGLIAKIEKKEQKQLIPILDDMIRNPDPKISNVKSLAQIRLQKLLYERELEKEIMDPIEDHFRRKVIKYETLIKNFVYSGKEGKVPYDLWKELTSTNDKRWDRGKFYTFHYCHLKKLNFDVITNEELNPNNFTLHHQKYIFENMLTKQAFPINAYSHPKGRVSELEGKEWDLFCGGFILKKSNKEV